MYSFDLSNDIRYGIYIVALITRLEEMYENNRR